MTWSIRVGLVFHVGGLGFGCRRRRDGNFDWFFFHPGFDDGTKAVFEQLREDVF